MKSVRDQLKPNSKQRARHACNTKLRVGLLSLLSTVVEIFAPSRREILVTMMVVSAKASF